MIGFSVALTGIIVLLAMTSLEVRKIDRQLAEIERLLSVDDETGNGWTRRCSRSGDEKTHMKNMIANATANSVIPAAAMIRKSSFIAGSFMRCSLGGLTAAGSILCARELGYRAGLSLFILPKQSKRALFAAP
jgi:hypothetical protein